MAGLQDRIYATAPYWLQAALFNLHAFRIERHRYGRRYQRAVTWALERERLPLDRIREDQDLRLAAMVRLAYEGTAYYRDLFDTHGLVPDDVRGVADLQRIPLLTKDTVRAAGSALLTARPRSGWLKGRTSGTTGTPLEIWYDRQTCVLTNAIDRRHKIWAGLQESEYIGLLLGRMIVPVTRNRPPLWHVNHVQRQVWFSSFHLTDEWMPLYITEIRRRRIAVLEGYPSTLYVLARHVLATSAELPLRAAITSSETLHPVQRHAIERAFQCRVWDFFASAERVVFAAECEQHSGLHIAEEFGAVEVVDEQGNPVPDGQPGYLTGTTLHNRAMPLLRYRTSDVSAIESAPCPCGRTLRRITTVTTKAEDLIVTPGGRLVSPSTLTHPFKELPYIRASQIIQNSVNHVLVKVAPSGEFPATTRARLVRALQERLGPEVIIEVMLVEDIPREPSGKYRWVISHVPVAGKVRWDGPA